MPDGPFVVYVYRDTALFLRKPDHVLPESPADDIRWAELSPLPRYSPHRIVGVRRNGEGEL